MKIKFFLVFLLISCLFIGGCSAGTPEEQEQLAQALQSLGQEYENSSGWEDFVSQLGGEAATAEVETSEASWCDVFKALKEKEAEETAKEDSGTSFPWDEITDIFTGGGSETIPVATPTPIPAEPTAPEPTASPTPEPTATPTPMPEPTATPTPEPENEDPLSDGLHIIQRIERALY